MCGDYDSVIGMEKKNAIARFVSKLPTGARREPPPPAKERRVREGPVCPPGQAARELRIPRHLPRTTGQLLAAVPGSAALGLRFGLFAIAT